LNKRGMVPQYASLIVDESTGLAILSIKTARSIVCNLQHSSIT
jgi:hypothetical protein